MQGYFQYTQGRHISYMYFSIKVGLYAFRFFSLLIPISYKMTRYLKKKKKPNKRLLIIGLLIINRIKRILNTTIMIIDHAGYGKRTLFTVDF